MSRPIINCIQDNKVFEVNLSNCSDEVKNEIKTLWNDHGLELEDDYCYFPWDGSDPVLIEHYPKIHNYLSSLNLFDCLIHWWW